MSNIIPFSFEENAVRVLNRSGESWFVLTDVCRVLGIGNPSDVAKRLDDDEKTTIDTRDIIADCELDPRVQSLAIINESGLYSLILTSRKAAAKRFKKWVTAEVLPTIRKTGSYNAGPAMDPMQALDDPVTLQTLLLTNIEKRLAAEAKVEEQAPTVAAFERIAKAEGAMCITDAGKVLQMSQNEIFQYLRAKRWIYSRPGKPGHLAYQERIRAGDLEHKVHVYQGKDGRDKTRERVHVTAKGFTALAKMLEEEKRGRASTMRQDDLFSPSVH